MQRRLRRRDTNLGSRATCQALAFTLFLLGPAQTSFAEPAAIVQDEDALVAQVAKVVLEWRTSQSNPDVPSIPLSDALLYLGPPAIPVLFECLKLNRLPVSSGDDSIAYATLRAEEEQEILSTLGRLPRSQIRNLFETIAAGEFLERERQTALGVIGADGVEARVRTLDRARSTE